MVDLSEIKKALLIADRGYEGYNVMAHIQEKGWFFLIRVQDVANSNGIAAGLDLPDTDEFDFFVDLSLTTKQTNEVEQLLMNKNQFKYTHKGFDYLPQQNRKHDPTVFYKLPFRIARFKIGEGSYETVVTNWDPFNFPAQELKKLYHMRWGIETSFRELKYTLGLLHFHAKKPHKFIYLSSSIMKILYKNAKPGSPHFMRSPAFLNLMTLALRLTVFFGMREDNGLLYITTIV
jgi:IS4 transposase